jgi:trans-aconitate methyltransferase
MRQYLQRRGAPEPAAILDVGCSTGIGTRWLAEEFPHAVAGGGVPARGGWRRSSRTRWLAEEFPHAALTGVDASPYFLAVAEYEQR